MDGEPKPIALPQEDNQEQGCGGFSQEELENLFEQWLEQEKNGVQFPVDFDTAWPLAGYSRRDSARRYLPKSSQGEFFHVNVEMDRSQIGGRKKETIYLSCDEINRAGLKGG